MKEAREGQAFPSEHAAIAAVEHTAILREIHHRVGNNLQVLISILNIQARRTSHEEVATVLREMQNRFRAVASLYKPQYSTRDFSTVHFGEYLQNLARELQTFYEAESQVQLAFSLTDMALPAETAVPLALIANELLSNAFRHAFGGASDGNIRIALDYATPSVEGEPGEFAELSIVDDGVGLPAGFDFTTTESMGLFLVNVLARQLGGSVEIQRDSGTSIRLSFRAGE